MSFVGVPYGAAGSAEVDHATLAGVHAIAGAEFPTGTHALLPAIVDPAADASGAVLDERFFEAVGAALCLDTLDPAGVLTASAPTRRHRLDVASFDRKVTVMLAHDPGSVEITVRRPDGRPLALEPPPPGVQLQRDGEPVRAKAVNVYLAVRSFRVMLELRVEVDDQG